MSSLLKKKPRLVRSFIIIYVVLQTCFNLGLLLSAKIYIIPFYEASIVQRYLIFFCILCDSLTKLNFFSDKLYGPLKYSFHFYSKTLFCKNKNIAMSYWRLKVSVILKYSRNAQEFG